MRSVTPHVKNNGLWCDGTRLLVELQTGERIWVFYSLCSFRDPVNNPRLLVVEVDGKEVRYGVNCSTQVDFDNGFVRWTTPAGWKQVNPQDIVDACRKIAQYPWAQVNPCTCLGQESCEGRGFR